MAILNIDIGIFMESKITDDKYTPLQLGYMTLVTKASSPNQGGVALFWHYNATISM